MLQLDFDPQTVCRICLSADEKLGNLFLSTVVDGYITSVPDMVANCLDMEVVPSDGLPGKLCSPCKLELTNFYRFKQKSKRTYQVLRTMIPAVETVTEMCLSNPTTISQLDDATNLVVESPDVVSTISDEAPETAESNLVQKENFVEMLPEPTEYYNCGACGAEFSSDAILQQHTLDEHTTNFEKNIKDECEDTSHLLLDVADQTESIANNETIYDSFEVFYENDPENEQDEEMSAVAETIDDVEDLPTTASRCSIDSAESVEMMVDYEELDETMSTVSRQVFQCGRCDELFDHSIDLENHNQAKHGSMKCDNCEKLFTREVAYSRHVLVCKPEKKLLKDKKIKDDDEWLPDNSDSIAHIECNSNDSDGTLKEVLLLNMYECIECKKTFKNKSQLKAHVRNSHSRAAKKAKKTFQCTFEGCESGMFKTQILYEQHMKMHEHIDVLNNYMNFYPCHTCRQIFEDAEALKSHMHVVHNFSSKPKDGTNAVNDEFYFDYQFLDEDGYEEGEYKCGSCAEIFKSSNETKHHLVSVHLDKFTCPEPACGCQYDQFARFSLHMITKHINGNSHRCTHCNIELVSYDALQSHMRNDCKERKYACTHCEKKFYSKKALCHHMTQVKGKRFCCQYCGKSFSQQGELTIHLRMHTGERPFVCTVCGKSYKTSSMRTAHMDTHIPGKTFSCPICSKMLQTRTSYRNHIKRHTEEKKHACPYCDKRFFSRYHVNLHASKIHEKFRVPDAPDSIIDFIDPSDEDVILGEMHG